MVVAIVVDNLDGLPATLAAVRRQVYEPARVVIAGGDRDARQTADEADVEWVPSVSAALGALEPTTTHVWVLHSSAQPRTDALGSLVVEAERVEAGIAGSKLLDARDPERLVSVGVATDVFDAPYTGLDEGEIDAGQYDVVRDVAAVGGASLLMRRDLAKGLRGPDPMLPPGAAAIDLCQRARLRGGRIVVVPSSEVLVAPDPVSGWKEEAGQIRAMIKVYSPMTLLWALPSRLLLGLLGAIVAPFLGRWTLFRWVRAWAWNLLHIASTLRLRRLARHHRAVGDTELFRFQLRGSADLRQLVGEVGARLRERLPGDDRLTLVELGRELRQPAIVVGALALGFVLVASRTLWSGFPSVGYSLPLPPSGRTLVGAYAGGWNPAGFGSVEPLQPFLGLAGLVQAVFFDRGDLASGLLIAASLLAGIWGMTRLLRTWGVEAVPGMVAGLVLIAGPATRGIGEETGIGTIVAVGVLPWAMRVALARWPHTWRARLGRFAAIVWVSALLGAASPLLLLAPPAALLILALITPAESAQWRSFGLSLGGSVLAAAMLAPWITNTDLLRYVRSGAAFWEPGLLLAVATGIALVVALVTAPKRLAQIAGWGGVLATGGVLVARTADLGAGREVQLAGMALAALGSAVVVGATLDVVRHMSKVAGWRRFLSGIGVIAAGAVAVSVVLVLLPGRAALPSDELGRAMRFTAAATDDPASSRVLLVGSADELPGDSRTVRGAGYRVVSAPEPALWEAWLPTPRPADDALEGALDVLIAGDSFRAGELLSEFGIRWVIFVGDSPLRAVLDGQLDLVPLEGLAAVTFVSEAENPVRAVASTGRPWRRTGTGYEGEPDADATVFVAEAANSRWQPDWVQDGWGSRLSAAEGSVGFRPIRSRRTQAATAFGAFVALVALSWWGRRR